MSFLKLSASQWEALRNFCWFLGTVTYPNYVFIVYKTPSFKAWHKALFQEWGLLKYIKGNPDAFYFLIMFSVFVIPFATFWLGRKLRRNRLEEKLEAAQAQLNVLKELKIAINRVLDKKQERYRTFSEQLKQNKISKEKVYEEIIQPTLQKQLCCEHLSNTLRGITKQELKISVLMCRNNQVYDFEHQTGGPPSISIEELQNNDCTASLCLSKREIVIIEDVDNPGNIPFIPSKSSFKSMLCYPINVGTETPFIISITSRQPSAFKMALCSTYETVLQSFERRFLTETYLEMIKNH